MTLFLNLLAAGVLSCGLTALLLQIQRQLYGCVFLGSEIFALLGCFVVVFGCILLRRLGRWLYAVAGAVFLALLPIFLFSGFYRSQGRFFTPGDMDPIVGTSLIESWGFATDRMRDFFSVALVAQIVALAVFLLLIVVLALYSVLKKRVSGALFGLAVLLLGCAVALDWHREFAAFRIVSDYRVAKAKNVDWLYVYREEMPYRLRNAMENAPRTKEVPVHTILLVGESATSLYMGGYGYPRNTTPVLTRLLKQGGALAFPGVACTVMTVTAVPQMYSLANQYNRQSPTDSANIIDLANAAGVDTTYLSIQEKHVTENIYELARNAAVCRYLLGANGPSKSFFDENSPKDTDYLAAIETVFSNLRKDRSNLIIIHLFGSHYPFQKRLPKGYRTNLKRGDYRSDREFEYAESIECTDGVIGRILENAEKHLGGKYAVVYSSDHGEDIDRMRGGDKWEIKPTHWLVPFVVYCSPKYRESYPKLWANLQENCQFAVSNDLTANLVLSLLRIDYRSYQPQYDLASEKFALPGNWALTNDGVALFRWTPTGMDYCIPQRTVKSPNAR